MAFNSFSLISFPSPSILLHVFSVLFFVTVPLLLLFLCSLESSLSSFSPTLCVYCFPLPPPFVTYPHIFTFFTHLYCTHSFLIQQHHFILSLLPFMHFPLLVTASHSSLVYFVTYPLVSYFSLHYILNLPLFSNLLPIFFILLLLFVFSIFSSSLLYFVPIPHFRYLVFSCLLL